MMQAQKSQAETPVDCLAASRSYIDKIVGHRGLRKDSNVGKVLLLDAFTTQVVANVYSQTQILEKEFYLIEQLGSAHEAMPHLKAAVFIRPTEANIDMISREISDPMFKEYHIFFSNVVPKAMLRKLANADEHEVVKQVSLDPLCIIQPLMSVISINLNFLTLTPPIRCFHFPK